MGSDVIYGVVDEERKLNVFWSAPEVLAALPEFPGQLIYAVEVWRDQHRPGPGGAGDQAGL